MNSHTCNIYISQLSIIVVHMNSTSTKPYMFFRIDFLLNFIPHHEQFFLFFFMSVLQKFNRKKKTTRNKIAAKQERDMIIHLLSTFCNSQIGEHFKGSWRNMWLQSSRKHQYIFGDTRWRYLVQQKWSWRGVCG